MNAILLKFTSVACPNNGKRSRHLIHTVCVHAQVSPKICNKTVNGMVLSTLRYTEMILSFFVILFYLRDSSVVTSCRDFEMYTCRRCKIFISAILERFFDKHDEMQ